MKQNDEMFRITGSQPTGESAPSGLLEISQTEKAVPDLDRMMTSYGDGLLRLCYLYLKDMQLAEDAVQETFLKAYRNYGRFDNGKGEKTWVTRIAINVCKDMLRSAWNRRVNVREELNDIPDTAGPAYESDTTLIAAVMEMKPRYKEVLLLFYYEDMKISDIAQMLGTPESTVSVRLKRGREMLKKQLGGWYYGEE